MASRPRAAAASSRPAMRVCTKPRSSCSTARSDHENPGRGANAVLAAAVPGLGRGPGFPSKPRSRAAPQEPLSHREVPAFAINEGLLRNLQIVPITPIGHSRVMFEPLLILIAAAFLLAGFVKGVIGLGLPTVSMGLLAVAMQPSRALAIVIVPAIVTNIWQTFVGPYLRDII